MLLVFVDEFKPPPQVLSDFGVTIRGAPAWLTRMVCLVSPLCFQICVCFQSATLCVWAVRRMPQHTMETWAWPQWALFILLYFLFQSLGKCPVCVCVLLLGCVAKLFSCFLYADPLYVKAGRGFSGESLHGHFPAQMSFQFTPAAKLRHGRAEKNPKLMPNQRIATTNCIVLSFWIGLPTLNIFTQTKKKYVFWKIQWETAKSSVAFIQDFCGTAVSADIGRKYASSRAVSALHRSLPMFGPPASCCCFRVMRLEDSVFDPPHPERPVTHDWLFPGCSCYRYLWPLLLKSQTPQCILGNGNGALHLGSHIKDGPHVPWPSAAPLFISGVVFFVEASSPIFVSNESTDCNTFSGAAPSSVKSSDCVTLFSSWRRRRRRSRSSRQDVVLWARTSTSRGNLRVGVVAVGRPQTQLRTWFLKGDTRRRGRSRSHDRNRYLFTSHILSYGIITAVVFKNVERLGSESRPQCEGRRECEQKGFFGVWLCWSV